MVHAPYASAAMQPVFEQQPVLSGYSPQSPVMLEPTFDIASGKYVFSAPYQAPKPPPLPPAAPMGPYAHQFAAYTPQVQPPQQKAQVSYGNYKLIPAEQVQYGERHEPEPPWKNPPGVISQKFPHFNAFAPQQTAAFQPLGVGFSAQRLRY